MKFTDNEKFYIGQIFRNFIRFHIPFPEKVAALTSIINRLLTIPMSNDNYDIVHNIIKWTGLVIVITRI